MVFNFHPNVLALFAAIIIAFAQVLYRDSLRTMNPVATTLVSSYTISACSFFYYFALTDGVAAWPLEGLLWFALAGAVANFFGRYLLFSSIKIIGLARAQVLSQAQPIGSAILAVLVIGEQITSGTAAGTVGIVAGTTLLVSERKEGGGRMRPIDWIIPLVSAVAFSFAPTLRKLGFAYIPSATLALGVANLVAGTLQLAFIPVLERGGLRGGWSMKGTRAALLGGMLNSVSALCFWAAIKDGNLVEVVPIRRLSVLLVLVFSWFFFRRLERVTWRVVLGGLLSLGGVLTIAWSGG